MQGIHLRKYGAAATINFDLYEVDGVDLRVDAAHASGDTKIMKDEGAEANTSNAFTDEGQGYSIVLTATEMQAARVAIYIVDSATKVWLDKVIEIETYGNASAQHAFDFDTASVAQTGDNFARLGAPAGASVSVDLADVPTVAEFNARTLAAASYFDPAADTVALVTAITNDVGITAAAVDLVWDEVLTGATHNVVNSAGRRLRQIQEAGGYTGGAVYLDTVGGTAGTTNFENGVDSKQVLSIADANTIATSIGLSLFRIAPNSSITFAATQDGQVFDGSLWALALGGQQLNETHVIGAEVSGICTGHVHMDHCHLGVCSFAEGEFSECGLDDTITLTGANSFIFTDCYHEEDGAASTIDFGSAVGASEVHIHGWKGNLLVTNMGTGDILHFTSAEGTLTLDASNDGGTVNLAGTFGFTDNSTGMTINDNGQMYQRVGAAGANLTDLGGMSTGMKAEIESEVNDALIVLGLDHLVSAAVIGADVTDNSIMARLASANATADWDTYVNTTDSLEAASGKLDTIDDFLDTEIAALVVDVASLVTAIITNAVGADVTADVATLQAAVDALNDLSAAEVNTEVVDVMVTDTHAEPASVPGFPMSFRSMFAWVTAKALHKSITTKSTGVESMKKADSTTELGTATHAADATEVTKGKFS